MIANDTHGCVDASGRGLHIAGSAPTSECDPLRGPGLGTGGAGLCSQVASASTRSSTESGSATSASTRWRRQHWYVPDVHRLPGRHEAGAVASHGCPTRILEIHWLKAYVRQATKAKGGPSVSDQAATLSDQAATLRIVRLEKYFRRERGSQVAAIDDVSFELAPGKMVAVLGPSGGG